MRSFTAILLFLGLTHSSVGQINESDTLAWHFRLQTGGNLQSGNVTFLGLRTRTELTLRPMPFLTWKTQNNHMYQEFGRRKADNDLFSRNYLYYRPERRIYPYIIGYVSSNYRRKIRMRMFAGPGVTWQAIRHSNHVVKLSANVIQETSVHSVGSYNDIRYNGSDRISVTRMTVFLSGYHHLLSRTVRLTYAAYWQPSISETNNQRLQWDLGLEIAVKKGFSVNIQHTTTNEQVTAANVLPYDHLTTAGLSWQIRSE